MLQQVNAVLVQQIYRSLHELSSQSPTCCMQDSESKTAWQEPIVSNLETIFAQEHNRAAISPVLEHLY